MPGSKVLIVEDEVIVAMSIERTLSSFGYDIVGLSTTPEDAIRIAEELKPDLVLMDINLEGEIDGIDAAEKISENSDIPVVYLTSYSNEETLRRAMGTNPYGYLTKPVRPKEIYTTIETALNKHRAEFAEKKLRDARRTQWEVMNSIDIGLCVSDYNPGEGRCSIMAINDKACSILGVPGKEIWKRGADLGEFIPGVAGAVADCLANGRRELILDRGRPDKDPGKELTVYVIRILGSEDNYSVFVVLVNPDTSAGFGGIGGDGPRSREEFFNTRGRISLMKDHISSIMDSCDDGKMASETVMEHALEIKKILDSF